MSDQTNKKLGKWLDVVFLSFALPLLIQGVGEAQESNCTDKFMREQIAKFRNNDPSDRDGEIIDRAIEKLADCHPNSLPILSEGLKDSSWQVSLNSAIAIGKIGAPASDAVPELRNLVQDRQKKEASRFEAIIALGEIGLGARDSIYDLIDIFTEEDNSELEKEAVKALGKIGKPAIPSLKDSLQEKEWQIRLGAAKTLSQWNTEIELAISTLTTELQEPQNEKALRYTIEALKCITGDSSLECINENLREKVENLSATRENQEIIENTITALENLQEILNSNDLLINDKDDREKLKQNVDNLLEQFRERRTPNFIENNLLLIIGLVLLLPSILILWKPPFWFLYINEFFQRYSQITIGSHSITIPLNLISVGGYRTRVLDAWVKTHIKSVEDEFYKNKIVAARQISFPVSIQLDDNADSNLDLAELKSKLKPIFTKAQSRLLIYGEENVGKTSLACQIGKWALAKEQDIFSYQMLPILIESNITRQSDDNQWFLKVIRRRLQKWGNQSEDISLELLKRLLRKQRILVIIDGFSEMGKETKDSIRKELVDFPIYALVVTSRSEIDLNGVSFKTIKLTKSQ